MTSFFVIVVVKNEVRQLLGRKKAWEKWSTEMLIGQWKGDKKKIGAMPGTEVQVNLMINLCDNIQTCIGVGFPLVCSAIPIDPRKETIGRV